MCRAPFQVEPPGLAEADNDEDALRSAPGRGSNVSTAPRGAPWEWAELRDALHGLPRSGNMGYFACVGGVGVFFPLSLEKHEAAFGFGFCCLCHMWQTWSILVSTSLHQAA